VVCVVVVVVLVVVGVVVVGVGGVVVIDVVVLIGAAVDFVALSLTGMILEQHSSGKARMLAITSFAIIQYWYWADWGARYSCWEQHIWYWSIASHTEMHFSSSTKLGLMKSETGVITGPAMKSVLSSGKMRSLAAGKEAEGSSCLLPAEKTDRDTCSKDKELSVS
jgi:hypothetical protein